MGSHVLVVDDDPGLQELLVWVLTRQGYRAQAARTGDVPELPTPDAVLLDVPGLDQSAVELCRAWRAGGLQAPILVIAGEAPPTMLAAAVAAGATDCLVKPCTFRALLVWLARRLAPAQRELRGYGRG